MLSWIRFFFPAVLTESASQTAQQKAAATAMRVFLGTGSEGFV